MCNKKDVVKKVYEDILKDKKTFAMLKSELSNKTQLDEAFICKHILPLAKKVDPEITWQDILAFEKEALTQPKKISLTDLENISGGKASNVLLSCGLLALMGFSGLAASNVASADFIEFTKTKEYSDYNTYLSKGDDASTEEREKYEFVTLGDVPFYLQADHMVDGLLWFKSPDENKAFFVMDRKFENKNAVYTYSPDSPSQLNTAGKTTEQPSFEDIHSLEFKLFDTTNFSSDVLKFFGKENEQKAKDTANYLQESFLDADKTKFNPITHKDSQTLQLADDNPLYNFSRFYNPNYTFSSQNANQSLTMEDPTQKGTILKLNRNNLHNTKMYAKPLAEKYLKIEWSENIKKNDLERYAESLKKELLKLTVWTISHLTPLQKTNGNLPESLDNSLSLPSFNTVENHLTLARNKITDDLTDRTCSADTQLLRNDGFVFFTLHVRTRNKLYPGFFNGPMAEASLPFENIPLASCSKDMFHGLKSDSDHIVCFNGSSEEIKDQLVTHYINEKIDELLKKDIPPKHIQYYNSTNIQEIRNEICKQTLEVRIPTHVAVDKWEKVELK